MRKRARPQVAHFQEVHTANRAGSYRLKPTTPSMRSLWQGETAGDLSSHLGAAPANPKSCRRACHSSRLRALHSNGGSGGSCRGGSSRAKPPLCLGKPQTSFKRRLVPSRTDRFLGPAQRRRRKRICQRGRLSESSLSGFLGILLALLRARPQANPHFWSFSSSPLRVGCMHKLSGLCPIPIAFAPKMERRAKKIGSYAEGSLSESRILKPEA